MIYHCGNKMPHIAHTVEIKDTSGNILRYETCPGTTPR